MEMSTQMIKSSGLLHGISFVHGERDQVMTEHYQITHHYMIVSIKQFLISSDVIL